MNDVIICAPCMYCIRANCNVQRRFETTEKAELWQKTFPELLYNVVFKDCTSFVSSVSYLEAYRSCENALIAKFNKEKK